MKEIKEVLLIVNPIAGDLNKDNVVRLVKQYAERYSIKFHQFNTTGENDKDKILSELDNHSIDRIIIAGGDGTINLVAEAIKNENIPIGLIPSGSANGLATNLDLPEDLEEKVETAFGENLIELDMLCINDQICLHMSDLGVNAELIRNFESSRFRGKFGYFVQSFPTLWKSSYPFNFCIKTEKCTVEKSGVLLAIANASKYGSGANVNPDGKPDDGIFEILVFKKLDVIEILKLIFKKTELHSDFVEIISAREAKITANKPVAFQIDGEFMGEEDRLKIHLLDRKLKISVLK